MTVTPQRRRLIIALILIPVFIGALDLTIVSAILPEVLTRLNILIDTNLGLAAWAITGYLLAYTVSMVIMGRISDLVGRRSVYLICLAIFVAGSWWVASSSDFPTDLLNTIARQVLHERPDLNQLTLIAVIIGRIIQALGAGAMVPVSMALIGDLYPRDERAQPIGLIGALDTAGWVLGHLYGGVMVKFFNDHGVEIAQALHSSIPDWHTLFWINVPIGILAFALTAFALRGVAHPAGQGRFDVIGAALIGAALIALSLGLGGSSDVSTTTSLATVSSQAAALPLNLPVLIGALVCFIAFLAWEWITHDPLIDLHLFRKRNVAASSLTNLVVGFCLMLGLVSVPLLVNLRAENASSDSIAQAAQQVGILLSAFTIPMALAAIPGGSLSNRIGYRATVLIGVGLAMIGFLAAGLTWRADTPDLLMAAEMIVAGVGLGLTISPVGTAVINEANEQQRGVTSALVIVLRLVGMTVAVSSMTAYALGRVNQMVNAIVAAYPADLSTAEIQARSVTAYFSSAIHAVDELLLIGAAACLLAFIPAMFMRGNPHIQKREPSLERPRADVLSAGD